MANKPPIQKGSRAKLRNYFTQNVGKILESEELREIAGTSLWAVYDEQWQQWY